MYEVKADRTVSFPHVGLIFPFLIDLKEIGTNENQTAHAEYQHDELVRCIMPR